MAEKSKRLVQWGVRRKRDSIAPTVAFMRFFAIRKAVEEDGIVELLFQESSKLTRSLRIVFDGHFLRQNSKVYTDFLAKLDAEPSDTALDEQVPYASDSVFSNFIELSRSGQRTETTFGLLNLHDVGEIGTRKELEQNAPVFVEFLPVVTIYSDLGFQLKLVTELIGATESH
jgi:hypothetical protein